MADKPEGLERDSPGQRPGLWGGPPFSLRSALKGRDRRKCPLRPFRAYKENRTRRQTGIDNVYPGRCPGLLHLSLSG